ncbi:hypothetical protein [Mammaliicoccus sciuri]|uniref:hypothetical protein n=1 Tax=Mammaliicoccus sciuri TaxID=1296 RepID=UPI00132F9A27|nr:hypothetical protein [Mammaliicoccus sciuri]
MIKDIENCILKLENKLHVDIRLNDTTGNIKMNEGYQIDFSKLKSDNVFIHKGVFSTFDTDIFNVLETYKIINETNLPGVIDSYRRNLTDILSNHHLNLSLNSIEKVNNKLEKIDHIKKSIKRLENNIHFLQMYAMTETRHPSIINTKDENTQKEQYKTFYRPQIDIKLEEIEYLKCCIKESQVHLAN